MQCKVKSLGHHMYDVDGVEQTESELIAYLDQFPDGTRLLFDGEVHEIRHVDNTVAICFVEAADNWPEYILVFAIIGFAICCLTIGFN